MSDWQTPAAVALGLLAVANLLRRWWPTWRRLLRPRTPPTSLEDKGTACHQPAAPAAMACGGGCGNCAASAAPPSRDHRIALRRPPRA